MCILPREVSWTVVSLVENGLSWEVSRGHVGGNELSVGEKSGQARGLTKPKDWKFIVFNPLYAYEITQNKYGRKYECILKDSLKEQLHTTEKKGQTSMELLDKILSKNNLNQAYLQYDIRRRRYLSDTKVSGEWRHGVREIWGYWGRHSAGR